MNKAPSRSSPARRDLYVYGDNREVRRDRSPLRTSPRRDSRDVRDDRASRTLRDSRNGRDGREPRERDSRDVRDTKDTRDSRDLRDARDTRDARDSRDTRNVRETRDTRDLRDPLYDRYRDARDTREPLYRRDDPLDKYRQDDMYRKKDDSYVDRYRDPLERHGREPEDRIKREERRREELYRKYFDEIQRRFDAERPVDCSVVVVNKQSKEYAEIVGRKVRDLGMMVDLIFLNTEVSLTQALEDITRGGSPFAIVVTQQHQVHCSCTVNILFGTPQEHRNMPIADAMILVARNYERFKSETQEKEKENIGRQAAKMAAEAMIRERDMRDEGMRGSLPPSIQAILGLLADNRYVTTEEIDKVLLYLHDRKERLLRGAAEPLPSQLSRPSMGGAPGTSLEAQAGHGSNPPLQITQPMASTVQAPQGVSNQQQELQAKILSLFNSGASSVGTNANSVNPSVSSLGGSIQSYGNVPSAQQRPGQMNTSPLGLNPQRSQIPVGPHSDSMGPGGPARNIPPRPGPPPQAQVMYGAHQNRPQVPSNVPNQRPPGSGGINFDNPSVQKALDTLIQSGPALSHLVNQTAGQGGRGGPPPPQSSMGPYQRHY